MTRELVAVVLAAIALGASAAGMPTKAPAARTAASRAAASTPAAPAAPVEFNGTFATGTTYVADMFYDAPVFKTWRPVKEVKAGPNVAWTIAWTNLDHFPALKTAPVQAHHQRFRFRVLKVDNFSGSPNLPWTETYRCEVLAVDRIAAAAPQPGGHRR